MTATSPLEQHPVVVGNVFDKFEDFDDESVFKETEREAGSESCKNFVVEFGSRQARVARDLEEDDFKLILEDDTRGEGYPIRWINVWNTFKQDKVVEVIGEKYGFSERLRALMKMKPTTGAELEGKSPLRKRQVGTGAQKTTPPGRVTSTESALERGEKTSNTDSTSNSDEQPLKPQFESLLDEDIRLYLLLKDTVNYFSIDHTDRALCIGAHWLYRRPTSTVTEVKRLMPPKHWIWLTICNDNTVLSFHEQPSIEPAPSQEDQNKWELNNFKSMRANMLSVLSQISTHGFFETNKRSNPLTQSSVRKALRALEDKKIKRSRPMIPQRDLSQVLAQEGASNLFYYLFEDYAAAGPFQAARDTLRELTPIVLQSDSRKMKHKTSEIIPRLHMLSKELRELRHLFENYKNLIKKIMATTKPEGATGEYPWNLPGRTSSNLSFPSGAMEALGDEPRVVLVKSAMDRFDRLADRLEWVVLNTIQGHLEEITALSDTYFNLTQQKDSSATAKLNRSATLLAKLSVFFLPISFMTGYFGVEISDLNQYWTAETYWYAFAGIASISFLSLFFFGRLMMFLIDTLDDMGNKSWNYLGAGARKVVGWWPSHWKVKGHNHDPSSTRPDAPDA